MTKPPSTTTSLPPTSPPRRRRRTAVALGAGVVLLAAGGAVALGITTAQSLRHDTVSESVPGVRALVVDVDEGSIALRAGTGPDVQVRTTRSWTQDEPTVARRLDGGVLSLSSDCPAFNLGCEVEREIIVPAGTTVQARTVDGPIHAAGLTATQFTAATVGGSVTASFAHAPEVQIQTVAGAVLVTVPPAGYRVATATVSGDVRVEVGQDQTSAHRLSARTVSGSISILPG